MYGGKGGIIVSDIKNWVNMWIERIQVWCYKQKVKKLNTIEMLYWSDKHPAAKKLLNLRGMSDLSILEKASLPIDRKEREPSILEKESCCHYHKFKLVELSIGIFAIARADEEEYKMPISIHGFIRVERDTSHKYFAFLVKGLASGELAESKEIDSLLKEALDLTEEAVDDEFSD